MTTRRANPYLHATWVAKALVGDKSSLWAYWFKANNQGFAKVPSTFDSARWNMEHTQLLDELAAKLEVQGCQVFIERQNDFRVESRRSGVVISGTPDIITIHPDGRAVIYDVKTGQPSASHTAQVQLYRCNSICIWCPGPGTAACAVRLSRVRSCIVMTGRSSYHQAVWIVNSSRR